MDSKRIRKKRCLDSLVGFIESALSREDPFAGVNLAISRLDFFRNFDFAIFLRNGFKHNKLRVLE